MVRILYTSYFSPSVGVSGLMLVDSPRLFPHIAAHCANYRGLESRPLCSIIRRTTPCGALFCSVGLDEDNPSALESSNVLFILCGRIDCAFVGFLYVGIGAKEPASELFRQNHNLTVLSLCISL